MNLFEAPWTQEKLLKLLNEVSCEELFSKALEVKTRNVGTKVYFRGLIEMSNVCAKDCYYCGIRMSNEKAKRFHMTHDEVMEAALWCFEAQYGSVVIQAGERSDEAFVEEITSMVSGIREKTQGKLGITLSLGEQTEETYQKWFEAGAHRYLLRIETSSQEEYSRIHPQDHSFEERVACLEKLRRTGYQVGSGILIGYPGQSQAQLVQDLLFLYEKDLDMIGMGPYVVHRETPLGKDFEDSKEKQEERFSLALKMIAMARLMMPKINIASATALQALDPAGREKALLAGANIIMPDITDVKYRGDYSLYEGKPCVQDTPQHCAGCLKRRIESVGHEIAYGEWGDSPRFFEKKK